MPTRKARKTITNKKQKLTKGIASTTSILKYLRLLMHMTDWDGKSTGAFGLFFFFFPISNSFGHKKEEEYSPKELSIWCYSNLDHQFWILLQLFNCSAILQHLLDPWNEQVSGLFFLRKLLQQLRNNFKYIAYESIVSNLWWLKFILLLEWQNQQHVSASMSYHSKRSWNYENYTQSKFCGT